MSNNGSEQLQVKSDSELVVTGDLDYQTVPAVWKASLNLFDRASEITIDLSEVHSSNSAGLALLIEWMRVARSKNCSIRFMNIPDQMQQVAQLCGVDDKLPV